MEELIQKSIKKYTSVFKRILMMLLLALAIQGLVYAQSGHVMNGVSAIDEAMGGAGSAVPLDASSAMHWNPSGIAWMPSSQFDASLQLMFPKTNLISSVNPSAFGDGFPQQRISGNTSSTAGPFPIPSLGLVMKPHNSNFSYGVNVCAIGGFGVDYKSEQTNPLTTPQPPGGMGFGAINSQLMMIQLAPTVAYKLTDHISLGIAPLFNFSSLKVNPFPATNPNDANGNGYPSYPNGPTASAFGFGFNAGVMLHDILPGVHFGVGYRSTQRFDRLKFKSNDEMGNPIDFRFKMDCPQMLTVGVGYTGTDRLVLAADFRYIDYGHTRGFKESGFTSTGAVAGFGWRSIAVLAAGIQYNVTDRMPIRLGYAYNQNPIRNQDSFYNVAAPAVVQNHLGAGLSYKISPMLTGTLGFQYGFKNKVKGNWMTINPQNGQTVPVSGTEVQNELSTSILLVGITINPR